MGFADRHQVSLHQVLNGLPPDLGSAYVAALGIFVACPPADINICHVYIEREVLGKVVQRIEEVLCARENNYAGAVPGVAFGEVLDVQGVYLTPEALVRVHEDITQFAGLELGGVLREVGRELELLQQGQARERLIALARDKHPPDELPKVFNML